MDAEENVSCPYCSASVRTKSKFCIKCGKSMFCRNTECNARIEADAQFCDVCGSPVNIDTIQPQMNTYVRKTKQRGENYSDHIEFTLTNHAVSEIAPFITGQVLTRDIKPPVPPQNKNGNKGVGSLPPVQHQLFDGGEGELEEESVTPPEKTDTSANSNVTRYFKKDGDYLVIMSEGFKGTDWKNQQIRFILMYVAAYEKIFGKPVPDKKHLTAAAQIAKIYDQANFSRYVSSHIGGMISEASTGLFIKPSGEDEIVRIIGEMENPNIAIGHAYWSRSAADKQERHYLSGKDKEAISEWAKQEVDLGRLDVRNIKEARDYAILALWILTVHLKVSEAVFWNEAYYYYKEKYDAISASPAAFSKALASKGSEIYFRVSGEKYFLDTEAVKLVEGWVSGTPVEPFKKEKGK